MDYYERYEPECTEETIADGITDSASVFTLADDGIKDICTDVYVVQPGDTYYGIAAKLGITAYQLSGLNPFVNPDAIQVDQRLCIPLLQPDSAEASYSASVRPRERSLPEREHEPPTGYAAPIRETQIREAQIKETQIRDAQFEAQTEAKIEAPAEAQSYESKNPPEAPEVFSTPKETQPSFRDECTMMAMPHGWSFYNILVRYGVSYDALARANPGFDLEALSGGQVIYIPPVGSRGLSDDSGYSTHIVERFETLDSISRKYRVSTASLLKTNPNLAPHDFIAGRVILVPNAR